MSKSEWKLIYSNYGGMEKKAVDLISAEAENYLNYPLPCEKSDRWEECNTIVVGSYRESGFIRQFIKSPELPPQGYVVKVIDHPCLPEAKLALITGETDREVFYGAVDFVDDYFAASVPFHINLPRPARLLQEEMPDYYHASAPKIKKRSVFTWGHPIKDYQNYIQNMARLKLNQLILWNDYAPVNLKEVVDFAHSYGIEVFFGYSWGWGQNGSATTVDISDPEALTAWKDAALKKYEEEYAEIGGDGIYFQTFTESFDAHKNGLLIAECVEKWVNTISSAFFKKYPALQIQFGLHATSVKDHLNYIAKIDPRLDIIWEDCGAFPYHYRPQNIEGFEAAERFTSTIASLRKDAPFGVLLKGQNTLDWTCFEHQRGPFIMGKSPKAALERDLASLKPVWHILQSEWIRYGSYAQKLIRQLAELTEGNVTIGTCGMFSGGIWFPQALCAQLMWDYQGDYGEIVNRVAKRQSVILS